LSNLALGLLAGVAAAAIHNWVTGKPVPREALIIYETPATWAKRSGLVPVVKV